MTEQHRPQAAASPVMPDLLEIDTSKIASPVLARLIEEVRNEESLTAGAYNRTHNRHNRGR